jgi:hypothetical protein
MVCLNTFADGLVDMREGVGFGQKHSVLRCNGKLSANVEIILLIHNS